MKSFSFVLIFLGSIIYSTGYAQINLGKMEKSLESLESKPANSGSKNTSSGNSGASQSSSSPLLTSSSLSESEIVSGLKEALSQGANKASTQLSQTDGFWKNPLVKIPFPKDCQNVATELRKVGMGDQVDKFELSMNRAAEQASKEAAPIFGNAIKNMSITDAKNILLGGNDTAATHYLRENTSSALYSAFSPHVKTALDQHNVDKLWADLAKEYNKIPFVSRPVETDLVKYTTNKALRGVFVMVGQEEQNIRKNPVARTSDVLKKVFGNK